jgi:pimeloyl-ACP methyl ester carboxylesterase
MTPRKISIESYPTPSRSDKAALLFVHGAYVNSSCWTFNFIPFFQAQGYDCFTVDLSGHGDSEGRERIDDFGIGDYVDDVKLALEPKSAARQSWSGTRWVPGCSNDSSKMTLPPQ